MESGMIEKYHIHRMARQLLDQISPVPDGLVVPDKHLNGLDNDDFVGALRLYQGIIESMLRDVINAPESFELPCIPLDEALSKPVAAKQGKAFYSLTHIFRAIGQTGVFMPDGGLHVNIDAFKRAKIGFNPLYVINPHILLQRLTDYGFEYEGLCEDCSLKNRYGFTVYYPDNPHLLRVLKVFGSLHVRAVDYRYLFVDEDDLQLNNFYTVDDVLRRLIHQEDREFLLAVHEKLAGCGYPYHTFSPIYNGVGYRYKDGAEMLLFEINHSDETSIKFTPRHVAAYQRILSSLSENIRNVLLNDHNCTGCGKCTDSPSFIYDGKAFSKCMDNRVWRPRFTNLNEDDRKSVLMMLDCEQ